jgi:diguanylate cyclase (GGDEF)-like protein/PAS domain S-box-containing protein
MAGTSRPVLLLTVSTDEAGPSGYGVTDDQHVDALAAAAAFDLARVTSLAGATTHLETTKTECVLIDLRTTDPADVTVITTLSAHSPGIALVALTGGDDEDLDVAAMEAGATDCLCTRTLDAPLLGRAVRHAIVRKRGEASLAEAQTIAQVGSWEVDVATGRVTWSRELSRLFALEADAAPTYETLLERTHPDDRAVSVEAITKMRATGDAFEIDHRVVVPDGDVRWIRGRGRIEYDAAGHQDRIVGTAQDITDEKMAEEALHRQAFYDALTGLPNRLLLLDRLGQALARLPRQPSTVGVIYLDIDRFNRINDSLGQEVGDQLLVAVATRLGTLARQEDTVARIGADEFVMLCESLSGESEAVTIADRIRAAMTDTLDWGYRDLVISVTAGVALATSDVDSAESILRDAKAAMSRAKTGGMDKSAVFAQTMRTRADGRLETEMALRRSIAGGDLRLHYQPIVTLAQGEILGHEALVRWAHPTRGLLGPDEFITVAEETGLIVPLGVWVIEEACRQAKRFQNRHPQWADLTMSVNLSGGQLGQPDLIDIVASAMRDAELKPEHLQLEMTESVLMDDAANTITILETLKGLAVRLGVDDFGTGYSSLSYLRRFPVDVLKIDRSFVGGLGADIEDSAIVAAIVSLADTLGLTAIAEGVETTSQRDCLISLGCVRAQGYLFARPLTALDAERSLDAAVASPGAGADRGGRLRGERLQGRF